MRLVTPLVLALLLAAAPAAQTLTRDDPRVVDAVEHAAGRARALGASAADVAHLAVTDAHADARSGLAYVYLRQTIEGIEVAGSEVTVVVGRAGRAVHAAGAPVAGLERRATQPVAALSPADAVSTAASAVGAPAPAMAVAANEGGADRRTTYVTPETALAPLVARLVYHAAGDDGPVRLAWEVGPLEVAEGPHAWMVRIDAISGGELWRADLTARDPIDPVLLQGSLEPWNGAPHWLFQSGRPRTPDQYLVYAAPKEGPNEGERDMMVDPADVLASPYGWHDIDGAAGAEYTITRGNNVHAYLDTDNDGAPDPGLDVDGGPTLTFDFPIDLTQQPGTYQPAAVTNNFYWSNFIHDIAYQYGFTEAAGNFQVNNYGRGGLGNDDLRSEAQDGGGTNNANFSTPAEGSRPRMQMYLYTQTSPRRDGDLSNMTLVHEYTHGISNRLTGGPTVTGCLSNQEQMGEGWSDWLAAMLTMETGDTRITHRPYGVYPRNLDPNGNGLRPAALNTDFARNDYHYGHTRTGHPVNGSLAVPHGIGFAWSTVIWEAAWEMIDAYGFSPDFYGAHGSAGNQMMIRLVIEGMKLQPCSPGFVSGRDAILAADVALYGGAHLNVLWAGFARRGLGFSASEGATSTNSDNMEAFDLPPLPPAGAVSEAEIARNAPAGGIATAEITIYNTAAAGSQELNFFAAAIHASPAPAPGSPPFLTASPSTGSVPPGDSMTLALTFDASVVPEGLNEATLRIATTDPENPAIDVPATMVAGGAVVVAGGAGWRSMAAPSAGLTVDVLAEQNLVEGIPGYYPGEEPNIFTGYDGTTWTAPAGGADSLGRGSGFLWYFYDETFDPGGPSTSVELPSLVEAPLNTAPAPAQIVTALHADGDGLNLVGNPFRASLNVSDIGAWASGGALMSAVGQAWDPNASTWRLSTAMGDRVAAWQGFIVENDDAEVLTIPSSARAEGGVFQGLGEPEARLIGLELHSTTAAGGDTLIDAAIAVYFHPDATDAWDLRDALKLLPLGESYATLASEGSRGGSDVLKAQESRPFHPEDPFDVLLDFNAVGTGTTYTIRWPEIVNVPDAWELSLQDLVSTQTVDLRADSSYTFTATAAAPAGGAGALAGAGAARFVLHVVPTPPTAAGPGAVPVAYALAAPAPNPSAGATQLRFDTPEAADVRIEVFDLLGRRVATVLVARVAAGRHMATLDAGALSAGLYVVRMRAGEFVAARRVTVVR